MPLCPSTSRSNGTLTLSKIFSTPQYVPMEHKEQIKCSIQHCQLSMVHCQLSIVHCQLSIVNCQLSIVHCQFSILNSQFSILHSQFSILNFPLLSPLNQLRNSKSTGGGDGTDKHHSKCAFQWIYPCDFAFEIAKYKQADKRNNG